MRFLLRLPGLLARPVVVALDTTVSLLTLPVRVVGLVAGAERTLAAMNEVVARTEEHLERTEHLIDQVDGVVQAASHAVAAAAVTIEQAEALTTGAAPQLTRYAQPPRDGEPARCRMADTTDPREIDSR